MGILDRIFKSLGFGKEDEQSLAAKKRATESQTQSYRPSPEPQSRPESRPKPAQARHSRSYFRCSRLATGGDRRLKPWLWFRLAS